MTLLAVGCFICCIASVCAAVEASMGKQYGWTAAFLVLFVISFVQVCWLVEKLG